MRKAPLALTISASLHATAVAWVATRRAPSVHPVPHAPAAPIEIVEIVPPAAPEPVAIALLDAQAMRELDQAPRFTSPARASITAASPRGHSGSSGRSRGEPLESPAGSAGSHLMAMRGPERPQIEGPSQRFIDEFLRHSPPPAPAVEPTGELAPSGNGHHRSNQGTFTVDVDRDGSAHIIDELNLRLGLALPGRRQIGEALSRWAQDPFHTADAAGRQQPGEHRALGDDDKPSSSNIVPVPVIGGNFDITDGLMRRHGQDPYASKKLQVLDATRDERAQIGVAHRREQLTHATQLMKAALDRVWAAGLDLAARKRAIFELWDDCGETGADDLIEATRQGRAYLIGFVNARFPAGSVTAFTASELAELNAHRQSRATFAPYGP